MFKRGTCKENQEWERLTIVREGYEFWEWGCTFLDVKRTPSGFEAYSECGFGESYSFEKVVFELADKQLKYRRISSGYDAEWPERQYDCAMVRDEVPAGYLNLREGPGMSFRVRAKLIPQRKNFKPGAETKGGEWVRVTQENGKLEGWVYKKYLEEATCPSALSPAAVPGPELPARLVGDWCEAGSPDEKTVKYDRRDCAKPKQLLVRKDRYSRYTTECKIKTIDNWRLASYRLESVCKDQTQSWTEISLMTDDYVGYALEVIVYDKKYYSTLKDVEPKCDFPTCD
jgi:SH3 domain-containing protein